MKSPGWLSPHCPEDGRELPNVSANALLQYRPQGFMENSNHQSLLLLSLQSQEQKILDMLFLTTIKMIREDIN